MAGGGQSPKGEDPLAENSGLQPAGNLRLPDKTDSHGLYRGCLAVRSRVPDCKSLTKKGGNSVKYLAYYIWFTAGIVVGLAVKDWLEVLLK